VEHVPIQHQTGEGSKSEAFPSCQTQRRVKWQKDLSIKSHLPKRVKECWTRVVQPQLKAGFILDYAIEVFQN